MKFSWNSTNIPANDKTILHITWSPEKEGAWRETITFSDGKKVKRDVVVILKSCLPRVSSTRYSVLHLQSKIAIVKRLSLTLLLRIPI